MSRASAPLLAELRSGARGRVTAGADRRFGADFGGVARTTPDAVVHAESENDLRHVFRVARARGVPVAVRGRAGSCNGQSLADGGILIAHGRDKQPVRLLDDGRCEISARSRWGRVEASLSRRGRSVPVLADYLRLSVGGTLSVGGYGADSILHGGQVHGAQRLRLVLPDGDAVWCSREEHPELFRFSLAGLGRVGVIDRAVLQTVSHRPVTTLFTYAHESLAEMVESFAWLAKSEPGRPELFKALQAGDKLVSTYGVRARNLAEARSARAPEAMQRARLRRKLVVPAYRAVRSAAVQIWITRFLRHRKIWADYLFDLDGLRSFSAFLSELQDQDAFGGCLPAVYLLGVRRPADPLELPFEAAGGTGAPVEFGIGLYSMVPPGDPDALIRVRASLRRCLARAIELGGRPYLYGWHELDPDAEERLYPGALERLRALTKQRDPDGLLRTDKLLRPTDARS